MTKLKTEELKYFFALSSGIKSSALYPALEVIKMDIIQGKCLFTKTNMNSYVRYHFYIEQPDCSLLLDDKLIKAFVAQSDDAEITISFTEKMISITDTKSNVTFERKPIDEFPKFPQKNDTPFLLPKEVVETLRIAKNYTAEEESLFGCVHLKYNEVFASNRAYIYNKKFSYSLPEVVLKSEYCNALSDVDYTYYKADNYDFFETESVSFGFIKSIFGTPNYKSILENGQKDLFFSFNKSELLKFCNLVNGATKEEIPLAKIMPGKLLYDEHNFNTKVDYDFETWGNELPSEFKFNTKNAIRFISALPYEQLNFSQAGPHYKIWAEEDPDYTGIISALN